MYYLVKNVPKEILDKYLKTKLFPYFKYFEHYN